jgi:hypothetical protein
MMDDRRSHTRDFLLLLLSKLARRAPKVRRVSPYKEWPPTIRTREKRWWVPLYNYQFGRRFPMGHAVVGGLHAISADANYISRIADSPSDSVAEGDQIPKSLSSWTIRGNFGYNWRGGTNWSIFRHEKEYPAQP